MRLSGRAFAIYRSQGHGEMSRLKGETGKRNRRPGLQIALMLRHRGGTLFHRFCFIGLVEAPEVLTFGVFYYRGQEYLWAIFFTFSEKVN